MPDMPRASYYGILAAVQQLNWTPIALLLLFFTGAFIFGLIWLLRRKPTERKPAADPTCGKCGYIVKGLTTFTCPECGSDLREVGIISAAAPPRSSGMNPSAPVTKTLTVMLTDMKDYTAHVADLPRDRMIALVQQHRGLVQPIVRHRSGRIIKSTGDGLIVVFDSATDALLAAIEIQAAAQSEESSFSERQRLPLRIAVSTGEVTLADGDVFGHPVNLASRVQQLASPGDVYFTDSTYHAMNRAEIGFDAMGAAAVKGLADKVNLYRALSPIPARRQ